MEVNIFFHFSLFLDVSVFSVVYRNKINGTVYEVFSLLAFPSISFSFENDKRQSLPGEREKWNWISIFLYFLLFLGYF